MKFGYLTRGCSDEAPTQRSQLQTECKKCCSAWDSMIIIMNYYDYYEYYELFLL